MVEMSEKSVRSPRSMPMRRRFRMWPRPWTMGLGPRWLERELEEMYGSP